jgi:hypothetical protein
MNKVTALIMALVFAIVLNLVVGFVVASVKGYEFSFGETVPYGIVLGLIIYLFGLMITSGEQEQNQH